MHEQVLLGGEVAASVGGEEVALVALGPLLAAGAQLGALGRPRARTGRARRRAGRSRRSGACRRRRARASRAAAGRRAAWRARPRSRRSSSRAEVRRVCPRCRSPWICCTGTSGRAPSAAYAARSRPACSSSAGHHEQGGVEPGRHGVGDRGRGQGPVRGDRDLVAQHVVDLAQRLAEPGGLAGEVAAGVARRELGVGEQVADAGERELPPVGGGAQELLQHPEVQHARRRRRARPSRRAGRRARSRPG